MKHNQRRMYTGKYKTYLVEWTQFTYFPKFLLKQKILTSSLLTCLSHLSFFNNICNSLNFLGTENKCDMYNCLVILLLASFLIYNLVGTCRKAIKDLSIGLKIENANIECLYLRASCYHAIGEYGLAVQ